MSKLGTSNVAYYKYITNGIIYLEHYDGDKYEIVVRVRETETYRSGELYTREAGENEILNLQDEANRKHHEALNRRATIKLV